MAMGQMAASDDMESYTGNPVGAAGGSGDWTSTWGANSQFGGGTFLSNSSKIDGVKSLGMFGNGSTTGTSVSRPFPSCTNVITISYSMRGDFNANSTDAPNPRRMAFTIRSGNDTSHFGNQRLSFFFAAGTTNFQWYDGVDRITNAVNFTLGHVYDVSVTMNPTNRAYTFAISNRNNGTTFSYSGNWTLGFNGEPVGSVAFFMRGPTGSGNDAFLDRVSVSSPDFVPIPPPPPAGPSIREGDTWKYFKGTSTPAVQGTNQWNSISYNDTTWLGPSPSGFGFSDCDDGTTLSDMQNNYLSVFTRKAFVVDNPASITRLGIAADYDDGVMVYLNGTEVARLNMPAGVITHSTAGLNHESSRGEGASGPNPKTFITIDPALLVTGTNVLAASLHNSSIGSSDASLIIELYTNTALTRGPFIQMPDKGATAAIAWQTSVPGDSVIDYGLDLTYTGGTVSNSGSTRDHTVNLVGLQPGTTYYYRVRSNGEILLAGQPFRTRPSADQPFRVVLIGDHGQGTAGMYAIANRVNARTNIDAIFTSGDNVYGIDPCTMDGAPGWYDPFFFTLYGPSMRRVPLFPALGNHDWDTASGQYMVDYFRLPTNGPVNHIGKNYSFEYGNMHVSVIDTEPYEDNTTATMNEINTWLLNDLASATQRWRVVILHRPPYTSQGNHNDNVRVKDNIVPILKARGVNLVVQGHNHFYERINAVDGTHYVNTAGGGAFLYPLTNIKDYSAVAYNARNSYAIIEVQGSRMKVQAFNDLDELIDDHTIDIGPPFHLDGLLDNPAWQRASNGLNLYAAIRGNTLYVATQDAGEGNDHFLYVASAVSTQRPANWAKSGTIMQWSAFMADENNSGFHDWFDAAGVALTDQNTYNTMTAGLNNNGTNGNGVLEGTMNVPSHFGSWPTQLLFAAAPYGTADGGALAFSAQVPSGNGDGDIQSGEFLALNPRDIALDLPVAEAGDNQTVEAGMWAVFNGSASFAPSGLPLSYQWQQVSGPAITTTNTDIPLAAFVSTSNIVSATNVVFRLRVNDGRFDSDDDFVTVTLTPAQDTDGDGLTDNEEITGYDNLLTPANPNGITSNPLNADSDGDGMNDGDEHLSGTNPGDPASIFKIVSQLPADAGNIHIDWSTVSGLLYEVKFADNSLTNPWTDLTAFTATSALSRVTDTNTGAFIQRYYRIDLPY
jgi:hypothetical protein